MDLRPRCAAAPPPAATRAYDFFLKGEFRIVRNQSRTNEADTIIASGGDIEVPR